MKWGSFESSRSRPSQETLPDPPRGQNKGFMRFPIFLKKWVRYVTVSDRKVQEWPPADARRKRRASAGGHSTIRDDHISHPDFFKELKTFKTPYFGPGEGRDGSPEMGGIESFRSHSISSIVIGKVPSYGQKTRR